MPPGHDASEKYGLFRLSPATDDGEAADVEYVYLPGDSNPSDKSSVPN
jgi:hypothetical protein